MFRCKSCAAIIEPETESISYLEDGTPIQHLAEGSLIMAIYQAYGDNVRVCYFCDKDCQTYYETLYNPTLYSPKD